MKNVSDNINKVRILSLLNYGVLGALIIALIILTSGEFAFIGLCIGMIIGALLGLLFIYPWYNHIDKGGAGTERPSPPILLKCILWLIFFAIGVSIAITIKVMRSENINTHLITNLLAFGFLGFSVTGFLGIFYIERKYNTKLFLSKKM
ncbi:MAG: hypothetical protein ABFD79_17265 [Phycisphaerales bacterium]